MINVKVLRYDEVVCREDASNFKVVVSDTVSGLIGVAVASYPLTDVRREKTVKRALRGLHKALRQSNKQKYRHSIFMDIPREVSYNGIEEQ